MREMILNEASFSCDVQSIANVAPLLTDLARGLAALINERVAEPALRMTRFLYDIPCARDGSLYDAITILQREGRYVEESRLLRRLAQKVPLIGGLPQDVVDLARLRQSLRVDGEGGDALMICIACTGIAVSSPSDEAWDNFTLSVDFLELIGEEFREGSEVIDNVARAEHARPIIENHNKVVRASINPRSFWDAKEGMFLGLRFLPGVRRQIEEVDEATLRVVMSRLVSIDAAALKWRQNRAQSLPEWQCKVTPESESTMKNADCVRARTFVTTSGRSEVFELHARFGSGGRIHLWLDDADRAVEVGYIGPHLPLAT